MRWGVLTGVAVASVAAAQWTDFTGLTQSQNLINAFNSKPAIRSGSGSPNLSCTAGKDLYLDVTGKVAYWCDATDHWTISLPPPPIVDIFQSQDNAYTLSKTPAPGYPVEVTLNGLTLCGPCGNDYTLSGQTLVLLNPDVQDAGPVIQVRYWAVQ